MPLPKIATPTYELELPSTGQTIQYRPFLVKEEKLLVLALEGEDVKEIISIEASRYDSSKQRMQYHLALLFALHILLLCSLVAPYRCPI